MSSVAADVAQEKYYSGFKQPAKTPLDKTKESEQKEFQTKELLAAAGLAWSDQAAVAASANVSEAQSAAINNKSVGPKPSEISLAYTAEEGDLATVSSSVIVKDQPLTLTQVARASFAHLEDFKKRLKDKFSELFEDSYSGCFSHNRLLAKLASVKSGFFLELMARMGVSADEIGQRQAAVRHKLCGQNRLGMQQVVYDETLLQIIT